MNLHKVPCFVILFLWVMPVMVLAGSLQYRILEFGSFNEKQGLLLRFVNQAEEGEPYQLDDATLQLSVGNGKRWARLTAQGPWQPDHRYHVRAEMADGYATLWVDGQQRDRRKIDFMPSSQATATTAAAPSWANDGESPYLVFPMEMAVSEDGRRVIKHTWEQFKELPLALLLFQPSLAEKLTMPLLDGDKVVLDVTFVIRMRPDLKNLSPFVDRYGQAIAASYPGKVTNDQQLINRIEQERQRHARMPIPQGYDKFGGNKTLGFSYEPTGFYRVAQRNGYWWMISPKGNPCFYRGVCGIPMLAWPGTGVTNREYLFAELPPKEAPYNIAWSKNAWNSEGQSFVTFHTVNMIRKYGDDWPQTTVDLMVERLNRWGFSGGGKWTGSGGADTSSLNFKLGHYSKVGHLRLGDIPRLHDEMDVFDPTVREKLHQVLAEQIQPDLKNPWILGWSIGNEKHFVPAPESIVAMMAASEPSPAKTAMLEYAQNELFKNREELIKTWNLQVPADTNLSAIPIELTEEQTEPLRLFFSDRLFKFLYETVKQIDPNHLYFGSWITPSWLYADADWYSIAPHCDVLGYDRYAHEYADERFAKMLEDTDKPVIVGEFGFASYYEGKRGFAKWHAAKDDADAGRLYHKYVREAAENPYCVGVMWFLYRDQPITGRHYGERLVEGENHACGLVDVTDTPKWDLVEEVRQTNLNVDRWRVEASREHKTR